MENDPCKGCWWREGDRCFNDHLAPLYKMEAAPRDAPMFSGKNGFATTDQHITACQDVGGRHPKAEVIAKFAEQMKAAGIEFQHNGQDVSS